MASTGGLENEVRSSGLSAKRRRQLILYGFGALLLLLLVLRLSVVLSRENYTITYWSFQIINGLVLGGVYALVALGYTMVYGILFMINFAHGEVMMMGGFAGYFTLQVVTQLGWVDGTAAQSLAALIIILLAGMITSVLVGVLLERVAYRPLRNAPRLVPLISAIGASFFLQYSALLIFGVIPHNYRKPSIISGSWTLESGIIISRSGLFIFVISIVMMLGLYLIINRSKMGRAMRAVAEDKEVAALMGVDVDRVIVFTFILGSALAGAGGVMLGLHNTVMRFNTGFLPGIKAFTAAVLGGIGNIPGAMFGAMTLGLLESLGPSLLGLPNEYKDVIAFSVLVLMLLFRPTGLLGERLSREKA
jgi:branched-chain amino acid transport system permease protein